MVSLSIKLLDSTKKSWEYLDLSRFRSIADAEMLLLGLDGVDAVGELKKGRKTVYLCGTEKWLLRMKGKGDAAVSFEKGVAWMRERNVLPSIVEHLNQPLISSAQEYFPGQPITEVSIKI